MIVSFADEAPIKRWVKGCLGGDGGEQQLFSVGKKFVLCPGQSHYLGAGIALAQLDHLELASRERQQTDSQFAPAKNSC